MSTTNMVIPDFCVCCRIYQPDPRTLDFTMKSNGNFFITPKEFKSMRTEKKTETLAYSQILKVIIRVTRSCRVPSDPSRSYETCKSVCSTTRRDHAKGDSPDSDGSGPRGVRKVVRCIVAPLHARLVSSVMGRVDERRHIGCRCKLRGQPWVMCWETIGLG